MLKRLILLFIVSLTAWATDLSGIWSGQMADRNGDLQDLSFRFAQTGGSTQKGGELSGKMYGDNESTPLSDLKVTGDEISFSVVSELNGQITKFIFTGTIKENEIQITRERAGARVEAGKPNPKQSFVLKRLT